MTVQVPVKHVAVPQSGGAGHSIVHPETKREVLRTGSNEETLKAIKALDAAAAARGELVSA